MTSAKCRDTTLAIEKKARQTDLKIARTFEISALGDAPIALVESSNTNRDGSTTYRVRAFVAAGDLCGDLEFYGSKPISADDANLHQALLTYRLDPDYTPQFSDVVTYAQILFTHHLYSAAAPIFEMALTMVSPSGAPFPSAAIARRIIRDQAGMSYGISGNLAKSRSIFEKAIAEDPDYPMSYYNLACADAEENKLSDAKRHLQQAFDRKANVIPGEAMPVPTEDDSFLPHKNDKEFWIFLQGLGK